MNIFAKHEQIKTFGSFEPDLPPGHGFNDDGVIHAPDKKGIQRIQGPFDNLMGRSNLSENKGQCGNIQALRVIVADNFI